jgi:hypothetical protein
MIFVNNLTSQELVSVCVAFPINGEIGDDVIYEGVYG